MDRVMAIQSLLLLVGVFLRGGQRSGQSILLYSAFFVSFFPHHHLTSHIITRALTTPTSLTWDYPYVIVYICSNLFPNKMKLVLEHEEEAIRAAMEVIGFSSEREAELKWYRSSK
jgi:hypothetical protein